MSSVADDSSIADSVSSIGQEEWEKVVPDDDESDIEEHETISRVPTPLVYVRPLQDAVLVFPPPSSQPEVKPASAFEASKEEDIEDRDDDALEVDMDNTDILMHWSGMDDFNVTFSEISDTVMAGLDSLQDAVFPLVKVTGQTAKAYLSGSAWKDLDHLAGAVRLRMAGKPLTLSRPLKLFYLGDTRVQGALEAKIGSALIAAGDDSEILRQRRRYSVMPVSWDKDSPEVELMPDSGANMDVETCVAASLDADVSQKRIEIVLQSGETISSKFDRSQQRFTLTAGYQLPDLAIIHLPENEPELLRTRFCAQKFLQRHCVPTIIISTTAAWDTEQIQTSVDLRTPHLSLQVPGQSAKDSQIFKRLPIDVDTFLRLNSRQLSRNLACFVENSPRSANGADAADGSAWGRLTHRIGKLLPRSLDEFITSKGLLSVSFLLMLLSAFYLSFLALYQGDLLNTTSLASKAPIVSRQTQTVTLDHFTTSSTPPSTTTAAAALQASLGKELMAKAPDTSLKSKEQESFEAQVHGDNVVIVRPPKWFAELRRAPTLAFRVVKGGKLIEHDAKRIDDKVYALSIPREHAHGVVDVHIQCGRLSRANQTIQVDLGSAWAKLLDWIKATSELGSGARNTTSENATKPATWIGSIKDVFNFTKWQHSAEYPALHEELAAQYGQLLNKLRSSTRQAGEQAAQAVAKKADQKKKLEAAVKEMQASLGKASDKLRRGVSQWRENHFRDEQKQLLKLWWKISGGVKAELKTKRQGDIRGLKAAMKKKAQKARQA